MLALLATPTIADKSWVWRQYDHQLFLNTIAGPGADAAVLRLKETDGPRPHHRRQGPVLPSRSPHRRSARGARVGAQHRLCRARPVALVNCLNFGNPEHPEVMWQFTEVVDGMSEACTALSIPVVGGNVSFYNESLGHDIDPTPVVGLLGIVDELDDRPPPAALNGGTHRRARRDGARAGRVRMGGSGPRPRRRDATGRRRRRQLPRIARARALVSGGLVDGVHDCSEGGLAVALAEMAIDEAGSTCRSAARSSASGIGVAVVCADPVLVDEVLSRGHGRCSRRRHRRSAG